MNLETIKKTFSGYIKTRQELKDSVDLINENHGRVSMVVFDNKNNLQGKPFGPIGYDEDEIDAIRREVKNGNRVIVSGLDNKEIVTVVGRK